MVLGSLQGIARRLLWRPETSRQERSVAPRLRPTALGLPAGLQTFCVDLDLLPRLREHHAAQLSPALIQRIVDRLGQAVQRAGGSTSQPLPASTWAPLAKAAHGAVEQVVDALPGALERFPLARFGGPVTRERLESAWAQNPLQAEVVIDRRSRQALAEKVWAVHGTGLSVTDCIPEALWPSVAYDLVALVDHIRASQQGAFSLFMARMPRAIAAFELPPMVSVDGLELSRFEAKPASRP